MPRIAALLFFLLLPGFSGLAQPVIEFTSDRDVFNIGRDVEFFVDDSATLTVQQLVSGAGIAFRRGEQIIPNYGITPAALWGKFRILNRTDQDCYLELSNTALDSIAVYEILGPDSITRKYSGVDVNFDDRELRNNNYLFRLCNHSDSARTYVLRVRHSRGTQFPLYAGTLKGLAEGFHKTDFVMGIYFGFMLLMVFYNLFIYFSVRDASYLYYVLYVACMALMNASLGGYAFEYLWNGHGWMGRYEDLISASLGITGILFAQHFLQLKQNAPFMNRLFQVLLLLFSAGIVLVLFRQFMLATVFIELVSLVLILIFFAAAFRVLRKGYKPARFFLFAWSALLIGVIVFVLKDFNIIPYSALSVHSLKIGSAVEALLLSMALANRINTYKREKEEAQLQTLASLKENDRLIRTQNIMLETKVEERTRELSEEKKKSDDLLLNILPAETAEELKRTGKARAKSFESVSVLFTDFKNFTQASESMSPEALVQEINECYSAFDDIVARHKLEKIKTIGDAYMCAGGLPVANTSNAADCVRAALEMQHFMKARSRGRADGWQLRVGIHTGPVVAGIVGIRKFAYDIWGDTVNIAARMESSGEPGKVNISGSTYTHVRDLFYCIHRGKVKAKNKGEIDMYFVEAHAPESSAV